MSVPIPTRKPNVRTVADDSEGFLSTIKNVVQGAFTTGLDFVSEQWEWDRQKEMMQLQLKMDQQAAQTNLTGSPTGGGSSGGGTFGIPMLAAISPVTLAILGVAGIILLKK